MTVGVAVWQKQQAKQFCALLFRFRSSEVFKKLCRAYLSGPLRPPCTTPLCLQLLPVYSPLYCPLFLPLSAFARLSLTATVSSCVIKLLFKCAAYLAGQRRGRAKSRRKGRQRGGCHDTLHLPLAANLRLVNWQRRIKVNVKVGSHLNYLAQRERKRKRDKGSEWDRHNAAYA